MIIDFSKIKEQNLKNFKGGENTVITRMAIDDRYKIARFTLKPGASIGYHNHDDGCEIVYILSGSGKALYDDGEETVKEGDCHYCPQGHGHSLINTGAEDLVFFAVVVTGL